MWWHLFFSRDIFGNRRQLRTEREKNGSCWWVFLSAGVSAEHLPIVSPKSQTGMENMIHFTVTQDKTRTQTVGQRREFGLQMVWIKLHRTEDSGGEKPWCSISILLFSFPWLIGWLSTRGQKWKEKGTRKENKFPFPLPSSEGSVAAFYWKEMAI